MTQTNNLQPADFQLILFFVALALFLATAIAFVILLGYYHKLRQTYGQIHAELGKSKHSQAK